MASGWHLEAAFQAVAGAADLNLFSEYESAWLEAYRGLRALHLNHADEAVEVYEGVLRATDPALLWERSRALYRLAWAFALLAEVERAADVLHEAVELTAGHSDRRGLTAALRIRDQHLGRWRAEPAVRRLDEAIRAAARQGQERDGAGGACARRRLRGRVGQPSNGALLVRLPS